MNYPNKLDSNKRIFYFFLIRQKIALQNLFSSPKGHQHLFILSPPFCGSTLLNEIISSSKNVSCNNNIGLKEGQHLPIAKDILFTKDRWNANKEIDWKEIHYIWDKYWNRSKSIFLEKSPPNICRAEKIEQEFKNGKFICLVRNPYSQIEGEIRRNGTKAKQAAELNIQYLKYQKNNIEQLKHTLLISYEALTENTNATKEAIISFLPDLSDINTGLKFTANNIRNETSMRITNLNSEKIDRLKENDVSIINSVFKKEEALLNYFNYQII
ncbi:sulfotransferase [Flavobacteriales bacterium]|nr:sulfotransferase [Flavobacteriales bacterium]